LISCCLYSSAALASVTYEVTKASCHGKEDGEIDLTVSGSNGPYRFEWSNGANSEDIFELAAGDYTVKVYDKDDCIYEETITVDVEEDKPQVNINGGGKKTFCEDDDDKTVTLTAVANKCEECKFQWSTGSSDSQIEVSSSGNYWVRVTDKDDCYIEDDVDVDIEVKDCDDDDDDDDDDIDIPIITSSDPNDIIGPEGVGKERWVSINQKLNYKIRFENDPDFATAPAQKVVVTTPIDPNANIFSFRLGRFGFGDFVFEVPENKTFYSTRLDVTDSLGVVVDLVAGIDVTEKEAFWIFESKDPDTGLPPENAELGFLLINDTTTRRGEAFVTFDLKPRSQAQTNDSIYAHADIVFDNNESILTNTVFNTVDAFPPASSIDAVDPQVDSVTTLTVTAEDDYGAGGSGVKSYDFYVSEDNGFSFRRLVENHPVDSAYEFHGIPGKDYCLYTIAKDSVGNKEVKDLADVCFRVKSTGYIALLSPDGDSKYCSGEEISLEWKSSGVDSIALEYSLDGGNTFSLLANDIPASDTVYSWQLPFTNADINKAVVRIKSTEDAGISDQNEAAFTIYGHEQVEISGVTEFCEGDTVELATSLEYSSYEWSNGETTPGITATEAGLYTVEVEGANGCTSKDSIELIMHPLPEKPLINVDGATTICPSGSVTLDIPDAYDIYNWSTGDSGNNISVSEAGDYWVEAGSAFGCTVISDTVSIVVEDSEKPTIVAEQYLAVDNDPGSCAATVIVPQPELDDNCAVASLTNDYNDSENASDTYPLGVTTVVWTVTDSSGNVATDTTRIEINDVHGPEIVVSDITVSSAVDTCGVMVSIPIPEAIDNCSSVKSLVNNYNDDKDASDFYPVGSTEVTWTAIDSLGNESSANMFVIVEDKTAPELIVPADISVSSDTDACGTQVSIPIPDISDNCDAVSLTNDYTDGADASGFYPTGNTIVTWEASDSAGNTTTGSITVAVTDNIIPEITNCPENIVVTAGNNTCEQIVEWDEPTTVDNCSVASINSNYSSGDMFPVGTTEVVYTVTDASGNETTCSFEVTVEPQPLAVTINAETYACGYNISCFGAVDGAVQANAEGGCAPYSYQWDAGQTGTNLSDFGPGTYVVTVTDAQGATAVDSVEITEPEVLSSTIEAEVYEGGFNISCLGESDGSATVNASGACGPYTYMWDDGQTTATATGLSAGLHVVEVTGQNGCSAMDSVILTEPQELNLELGQNMFVYSGYPDSTCVELSAEILEGGVEDYQYLWSTGETTPTISVCPDLSTLYHLTVTDANMCSVSDSLRVCIKDVSCGNGGRKVQVCHKEDDGTTTTLCIAPQAVEAHLAHGDYLGACGDETPCDLITGLETLADKGQAVINAYPNPFSGETMIHVMLPESSEVTIKVYDLNGIELEEVYDGWMMGGEHYEIKYIPDGSLVDGLYLYRVATDDGRVYNNNFILLR